ncbi:MAG: non-homologous end-joining DNA ligase [Actinomycetota bacterium]
MAEDRDYARKRAFDATPEPAPAVQGNVDVATAPPGESFVIQQHYATRLHFDLRLEMMNGEVPVLVSWAVPRNLPSKKEPHLAVHVEDHPVEYATFQGTIPKGNYGAGEVRIFDSGTYELLEQEEGKLTFRLNGSRMRGVYHMVRTRREEGKDEWLAFLKTEERSGLEPLPELTPMLATLIREPFDDEDWIFEPKWDGVRALAVCAEETRLLSRNRRDVTATYPELGELHNRLVAREAVVDGEVVAFEEGRPSFERLQGRINLQNPRDVQRAMKASPVCFIAFDLLYLDGRSLVAEPVEERKQRLDELVVPSSRLQVSTYVEGDGVALAEVARRRRLEGIVAKRLGSPYRPGRRTREWLKVKTVFEADVVVGGWSKGEGGRARTFGALLVGAYDDGGLRFLGSVGTGFTDEVLAHVWDRLEELASSECPFADDPKGLSSGRFGKPLRDPQWVRPELVAKVEFRELTAQAKRLRAPSFKGLRLDKPPEECLLQEVETIAQGLV